MNQELITSGTPVVYIPNHLLGKKEIKDNQLGIVSSKNDRYVFVNYKGSNTSQATNPDDLYPLHNRPDLMERLGIKVEPINRICEIWIEEKTLRES